MTDSTIHKGRLRLANSLVRFSGAVLLIGSVVKFLHPAKAVAYMAFFGFRDERLLLVAMLELVVSILFLLRSTRSIGLLLASAYLGGAIAVHVAHYTEVANTPILKFDSSHPYLGCIPAVLVLLCAWGGALLQNRPLLLNSKESRVLANSRASEQA